MECQAVNNGALEELLERLEHWDDLCAQLRELYYRYLDLAAFRSEKCFFPGRKCKRSWDRQYDMDDLTLMWTYIANTAPLCGKLIRALAEVEYDARRRALKSLDKHCGIEKRHNPSGKYEVRSIRLKRPVYGYLALWGDKLYAIWGEFDNLPKNGRSRSVEIERRVLDVIKHFKRSKRVEIEVEEYEVDREYERLWLEVPLPEGASKLLGGRSKAPVALFRNLGWLLSDDNRSRLTHGSGNLGQVTVRIFDWIATASYARRTLPSSPLVFKLSIHDVSRTKDGVNPLVDIHVIGTASEIIRAIYEQFGITLSGTERVIAHGYAVLKALREEAFKREGATYVVDDVGAWIAYSNVAGTLIIGDGYAMPTAIRVASKVSPRETLEGKKTRVKELAKALGGVVAERRVMLQTWHMRLLLPTPSTPAFEKTAKFYEALVNYPAAAIVEVSGRVYLFTHSGGGDFVIGRGKAVELYETVRQLGMKTRLKGQLLVLTYAQLEELARHGFAVRLLNDAEKDAIREIRPVLPAPDLDAVRRVLEEVAEVARISIGQSRGREYVYIALYNKSTLEKVIVMLKTVGIRFTVIHQKGVIYIREQRSVEAIRRTFPHLFHKAPEL